MGQWTWPICDACWEAREGKRGPVRLRDDVRARETCGWCGKETDSGIYVRSDPRDVPYGGE